MPASLRSPERERREGMTADQRIPENAVGEAQLEHDALYIGGRGRAARSRAKFVAVNPDTEQPFGSFPDASAQDADDAVIAARRSFDDGRWRNASMQARAQVLARLADLYRASSDDIAAVTTVEMGCPVSLSTMLNGVLPQRQLHWPAELATTVEVEDTRDTPPVGTYVIRREPVGVVAAVVPWNGPLYLAINKVTPAVIAGCSVVLKPAPEASLGLLHFAKLAHAAGIPDGVFNVVTAGREVGEHLVTHPLVDRVSFTGLAQQANRRTRKDRPHSATADPCAVTRRNKTTRTWDVDRRRKCWLHRLGLTQSPMNHVGSSTNVAKKIDNLDGVRSACRNEVSSACLLAPHRGGVPAGAPKASPCC
jgi:delta 1-pyrroline-5-carboxylate dehydrogenase